MDEALHKDSSKVDANAKAFYKLLEEAKQELYLKCRNFSRLFFLVRIFHIKCLIDWSNNHSTCCLICLLMFFQRDFNYQRTSM